MLILRLLSDSISVWYGFSGFFLSALLCGSGPHPRTLKADRPLEKDTRILPVKGTGAESGNIESGASRMTLMMFPSEHSSFLPFVRGLPWETSEKFRGFLCVCPYFSVSRILCFRFRIVYCFYTEVYFEQNQSQSVFNNRRIRISGWIQEKKAGCPEGRILHV